MVNQWIFDQLTPEQEAHRATIAEELGVGSILAQLLVQRGINTFDEAKNSFVPT